MRRSFVTSSSAFIPGGKLPGLTVPVRFLSIECRLSMAYDEDVVSHSFG